MPVPGPTEPPPVETRELSPASWPDFERLFRKYHGVQAGCWCMFYHREGPTGPLRSARRQDANRSDHHDLLLRGRAHGVLVFRGGRPVGWCQFGRREELPRLERGRKYRSLAADLAPPPRWRITCFFVDRPARRSGVAQTALHAALDAIRRRGGGLVEAYPATHGKAVAVWFGTVRMFEREGFAVVRPFGRSNVLVRKEVGPRGALAQARRRAPDVALGRKDAPRRRGRRKGDGTPAVRGRLRERRRSARGRGRTPRNGRALAGAPGGPGS